MRTDYLRFDTFNGLMRPFSVHRRQRRMARYVQLMGIREGMSVLDLGGQPAIWESVPVPLRITILNLPGVAERSAASRHSIRYIEGDACAVDACSAGEFDTVFSNSVIEHVGPPDRQAAFAREVRRLGKSYWVQTPSRWFPIEAHCGMPFWWFYPPGLRRFWIERWRRKLPAWTNMVEGTRVLSKSHVAQLFPEATLWVEAVFGLPKSYVAYHPGETG